LSRLVSHERPVDHCFHSSAAQVSASGLFEMMFHVKLPSRWRTSHNKSQPPLDLQNPPLYAGRYLSLLGSWREREFAGPAFIFPDSLVQPDDIAVLDDERRLHQHFQGWTAGEIAAGRAPVMAIIRDGWPVSICFSARSSDVAAEAGVETAEAFRGHGFAARVTAAWALSIRASGRIPLYSTSWTNTASLAVARKLNLKPYASGWSVCEELRDGGRIISGTGL
jgi:hypothetical protein